VHPSDVGNPHDTLDHCLPPRAGVASTADFADHCQWPSTRQTPGAVAVVAQGDQATLSGAVALPNLPVGRYLISVTADGYKIDGAHLTVAGGVTTPVTVTMQPYPLPLGTVRLRVFNDSIPVDGTYEVDSSHYGIYESDGAANGQTPCIWIRHNDEYVDGRVATGVIERGQVDQGRHAGRVMSQHA